MSLGLQSRLTEDKLAGKVDVWIRARTDGTERRREREGLREGRMEAKWIGVEETISEVGSYLWTGRLYAKLTSWWL